MEDTTKVKTIDLVHHFKNTPKEFEVISNENIKYKIVFEKLSSNLLITASREKTDIKYKKIFSLQYIQKVKLFTLYETIEECLDEIIEGLNMDNNSILEDKNTISLIIPLKNKKYNQIIFDIEKDKDKDNHYSVHEDTKNDKHNEITLLKKENNELREEILSLKEEMKEIKELIKEKNEIRLFSCIKHESHPCWLIFVDYKNKDEKYNNCRWFCDICHVKFNKQIPNFYCSKCSFDVCIDCYKKK